MFREVTMMKAERRLDASVVEHLRAVEVGGDYGEDPHGRRGGNTLNTVGTKRKDRCQMLLF